jgi:hypothetical protein
MPFIFFSGCFVQSHQRVWERYLNFFSFLNLKILNKITQNNNFMLDHILSAVHNSLFNLALDYF